MTHWLNVQLAHGALPKIQASKRSMSARMAVGMAGAASSITMAPTTASTASVDSTADERTAGQSRLPVAFCFGVRRKAASRLSKPRTTASVTTQLKANQMPSARNASPQLHRSARRNAQSPRNTPVTRKASGTMRIGPVSSRTGSR